MGLDMYLEKEIYIGANFSHRKVLGNINITSNGKEVDICLNNVSTICEQIGYLRKANHIHRWFVENVQNGADECQRSYVPWEKIKQLIFDCESVLNENSLARELLPIGKGFFFGSTQVGEWYFQDIRDTLDILTKITEDDDIFYEASW